MIYTYIPSPSELTLMGELKQDTLYSDDTVGLFLSLRPPSLSAWIELRKGIGGLTASLAFLGYAIKIIFAL